MEFGYADCPIYCYKLRRKTMIRLDDKLKRFVKFGIVGGFGVVVDLAVVAVMNFFLSGKIESFLLNVIAPCIAYEFAVLNNFIFSYFWVWKDRKQKLFISFLKYNMSTAFAFLIRMIIYHGSRNIFVINEKTHFIPNMFLYGIALGIGMIINFILMEYKVFKKIDN